jgi:hypothetical protein
LQVVDAAWPAMKPTGEAHVSQGVMITQPALLQPLSLFGGCVDMRRHRIAQSDLQLTAAAAFPADKCTPFNTAPYKVSTSAIA